MPRPARLVEARSASCPRGGVVGARRARKSPRPRAAPRATALPAALRSRRTFASVARGGPRRRGGAPPRPPSRPHREVAPNFRFCGSCGAPMAGGAPAAAPELREQGGRARTMFFGAMQAPGRAKLILIKGEGMDGVSYVLSATDHVAGRLEGAILFPE